MSAQSTLIACSNAGDCPKAGEPLWDWRTPSCPCCGKSLSSPHSVFIEVPEGTLDEGARPSITVLVGIGGNCAKIRELWLEINGKRCETTVPVPTPGKREKIGLRDGLDGGLYRIQAVLTTTDGRTTWSDEHLLFIGRKPLLFKLFIWVLLLLLLLSLSTSLGWVGKPRFGLTPHRSFAYLVDAVSVVSALLIGGLLLNLGLRERALAGNGPSLVRPARVEVTTRSDRVLNYLGETASSGVALIIVGALPFCFAVAHLAGFIGGGGFPWDVATVLLAVGGVVVAIFWGAGILDMAGKLKSKWQRATRRSVTTEAAKAAAEATGKIIAAPEIGTRLPGFTGGEPEVGKP